MQITSAVGQKIEDLYLTNKIGIRQIAKQLGFKHQATVHKYLSKRGLCRPKDNHLSKSVAIDLKWKSKNFAKSSELLAHYILSMIGCKVLKPLEGSSYDFLVEIEGQYKKIQVKSSITKSASGNCKFALRKRRNNSTGSRIVFYTEDEVDFFLLIDVNEQAWLVPFHELKGKGSCIPAQVFPGCKIK